MNEMYDVLKAAKGTDWNTFTKIIGNDSRIGDTHMKVPGNDGQRGYAGSCFPKDTKAIISTGDKFKTNLSVIKSVIRSNENRSKILLNRVYEILNKKVKNKKITFLGVTFKANTDDMRDSSSLTMIPLLSKKGAIIKYFDPTGKKKDFDKFKNVSYESSIKKSVEGSDLVIIHTEWNDFKSINFKKFAKGKRYSNVKLITIFPIVFIKEYFFQRKIFSGKRGFILAIMGAYYAFIKEAKLFENHQLNNKD